MNRLGFKSTQTNAQRGSVELKIVQLAYWNFYAMLTNLVWGLLFWVSVPIFWIPLITLTHFVPMSRSEFFAVFCASVKAIKSSLVPMIKSLSVPVSSCEFQRAAVTPIDPMWNVLYFSELFWAFLNPFESQLASVCLNPFVSRVSCKVRWVPVNPRESQISLCETFYVPVSRNEILFSFSWIQRGLCTTFF